MSTNNDDFKDIMKSARRIRTGIRLYALGAIGTTAYLTYRDGVNSLREHREYNPDSTYEKNLEATYNGCTKRGIDNIISGWFFPLIWGINAFPRLIMRMNPPE